MAKKVMIVEDNELNMKLFRDLIEASGYETVRTRNGLEALDLARTHKPDLILMDIQLPEVSGLEVTKWLKEDDELHTIPVIAVTAFAMKGDEERIRQGGCEAYISKPISVARFIETIKSIWRCVMTARILVVDDVPANVKLLEARLLAEYFEVLTASNGAEALDICERGNVDVVLLDVMMQGMDGFEVCRRLKSDPATQHIPVVMVTALDQVSDRVRGLEAGADDFLTKPANDLQLMTRVKSLVRLKSLTDELRLRASTTRAIRIEELLSRRASIDETQPTVLLVDDKQHSVENQRMQGRCTLIADGSVCLLQGGGGDFDCVLISTALNDFDPLRLCSQLRTLDRTRFVPIMLLADQGEDARLVRGLELGVNDYLVRPLDQHEMIARLVTQVRRKRYNDHLRASVAQTIEMAVTDPLTGLNNRRYLDTHLQTLFERAQNRETPLPLLIADIPLQVHQ